MLTPSQARLERCTPGAGLSDLAPAPCPCRRDGMLPRDREHLHRGLSILCISVIGNRSWDLGSGLPAPSLRLGRAEWGSVCLAHLYDQATGLWVGDKGLWPCLHLVRQVGQVPSPRGFNPWHLCPRWPQVRQGGIPAEQKQEGAGSRTLCGSHRHGPEQQHHLLPIQKGAAPVPYATRRDGRC